jgi:phosphatidylglycerophosphate synthase
MHPWRQRLERWLNPLARRCPFSPNAITVAALLLNLAAASLLAIARNMPVCFLIAPAVLAVGGLLDSFDGVVARVQNRSSRFGDFLDHFCDRAGDAAILAGWMIGSAVAMPLAMLSLALILLVGYLGTQIEATFGVRSYEGTGRGEFVLAFFTLPIVNWLVVTEAPSFRLGGMSVADLLTLLLALFAFWSIVGRMRLASRLARDDSQ